MTETQKKIVMKAYRRLYEAGCILCCSNSPMHRVEDQAKVRAAMRELKMKLNRMIGMPEDWNT